MTFDIPHMIATAVIILIVVSIVNRRFDNASKGKRAIVTLVVLFIALMILNLAWPYGAAG